MKEERPSFVQTALLSDLDVQALGLRRFADYRTRLPFW